MIHQQQRCAVQLAIVVIDPCAELAAQPGQEEPPFHLRAELALPALLQFAEQRQQQLFAQGARRVERHGLVEGIVDPAFGQLADGLHQGLAQGVPFVSTASGATCAESIRFFTWLTGTPRLSQVRMVWMRCTWSRLNSR